MHLSITKAWPKKAIANFILSQNQANSNNLLPTTVSVYFFGTNHHSFRKFHVIMIGLVGLRCQQLSLLTRCHVDETSFSHGNSIDVMFAFDGFYWKYVSPQNVTLRTTSQYTRRMKARYGTLEWRFVDVLNIR